MNFIAVTCTTQGQTQATSAFTSVMQRLVQILLLRDGAPESQEVTVSSLESWKSRAAAFVSLVPVESHMVLCCLLTAGHQPIFPP